MYTNNIFAWVLCFIAAYLLGSISGAIVASKLFHKTDIRKYGSGNAGMTNALRTFGKKNAALVIIIDGLKTIAAVLLAQYFLGKYGIIVAGAGAALGHAFPLYYGFKGGKCVMVSAMILLMMDWRLVPILFAVFLLVVAITHVVAAGSLVGILVAIPLTWFLEKDVKLTIFMACLAIFVLCRHHKNIKRMIKGTELPPVKKEN